MPCNACNQNIIYHPPQKRITPFLGKKKTKTTEKKYPSPNKSVFNNRRFLLIKR